MKEENEYDYQQLDDVDKGRQNEEMEENYPTTKVGLCWFRFVNCFDYFRKGKKKLSDESFDGSF